MVPVTEIDTAGAPASAVFGVTPEAVGAGFSTFTEKAAVPPPLLDISPLNVCGLAV